MTAATRVRCRTAHGTPGDAGVVLRGTLGVVVGFRRSLVGGDWVPLVRWDCVLVAVNPVRNEDGATVFDVRPTPAAVRVSRVDLFELAGDDVPEPPPEPPPELPPAQPPAP